MATTKKKGMGIKTSVKSGNFRPTKQGAGMTEKGVSKSFCARSAGQMRDFPKAAKDPNSRLRQARRRWKC
jgi:hypothetical protein